MPPDGRQSPDPSSHWLLKGAKAPERPETLRLAVQAWESGRSALTDGDLAGARFWLERANRLGPQDTQVCFLLGITLLRQGDWRCLTIFRDLVRRSDTLPAHRGLLSARALAGDAEAQRQAASSLLARFMAPEDEEFPRLAAAIAARAGLSGWCAANAHGQVTVTSPEPVTLLLDGRPVTARRDRTGRYRLPPSWVKAQHLSVIAAGQDLLGSPIDLTRHRLVEGFVDSDDGAITGWAWRPANPDMPVRLFLETASGQPIPLLVETAEPAEFEGKDPLSSPLAFRVPAERLSAYPGLLHVRDSFGRALSGSPIDPGQWTRSATSAALVLSGARSPSARDAKRSPPPLLPIWAATPPPARPTPRGRIKRPGTAVVIPVFRGLEVTLHCLARVFATVPRGTEIIVVDDASPEPALSAELDALARRRRIRLLRNPDNRGFPASANRGMAAAGARDVVLLNSDAMVPAGWLERLREAAYAAPDIGTVAPLSNEATILSYPHVADVQPPPADDLLERIDALAARANGDELVEIPTSVGFCMYIRRACLEETGPFREDVFAQGYGEENDFCLRARHLGWRHMAASGVFVSHIGGQSFRAARHHLLRRNQERLERLHPGYGALIAAHVQADPLATSRRRLDIARWQALRPARRNHRSVILITHDEGGGVERQVGARALALAGAGVASIVLRPTEDGACRVEPPSGGDGFWHNDFPNLMFRLPEEMKECVRFLRHEKPQHIELHHRLGHAPAVLDLPRLLGIPLDIHVHDYAAVCPRVTFVTTTARYCGEPDAEDCAACIADLGSRLRDDMTVPELRRRSADEFAAARAVIFPSAEVEKRFRRYLPRFESAIRPWEEAAIPLPPRTRAPAPRRGGRWRIGVIGAIGTEKGYDLLLACARDAARRRLPLEFVIIGFTHDDPRLMDTGHVQVTYRFAPERAAEEIAAQSADIGFIPSIWPETWCFALSDAWRAGLKTAVFDIGTQALRVRETGNGWVLPLALPPDNVNNTLISLAQSAG